MLRSISSAHTLFFIKYYLLVKENNVSIEIDGIRLGAEKIKCEPEPENNKVLKERTYHKFISNGIISGHRTQKIGSEKLV